MAKNEEGEFELVLGNRQLISVFLIVVILLAVFFSMGYIVGRNSAPGTATETARNTGSSAAESAQKTSPTPSSPPATQETTVAPAEETPPLHASGTARHRAGEIAARPPLRSNPSLNQRPSARQRQENRAPASIGKLSPRLGPMRKSSQRLSRRRGSTPWWRPLRRTASFAFWLAR